MPDHVRKWMTPTPITVSPSSPLRDAYWLMEEEKQGEEIAGCAALVDPYVYTSTD